MAYSVVRIQGKQYRVQPGDQIIVDRLNAKEGDTIKLEEVLLTVDGSHLTLGHPTIPKQSLTAKVISHQKGDKIRVATYKAKSRYRRVKGHRQAQTILEIAPTASKSSKPTKSSTKPSSAKSSPVTKSKPA